VLFITHFTENFNSDFLAFFQELENMSSTSTSWIQM